MHLFVCHRLALKIESKVAATLVRKVAVPCVAVLNEPFSASLLTGANYIGHNYIGHNYISHKYTSHNYISHKYVSHNYM